MQILCIGMQQTYGVTCWLFIFWMVYFRGVCSIIFQLIEFHVPVPWKVMRGFIGEGKLGRNRRDIGFKMDGEKLNIFFGGIVEGKF
jgi:hypothetical protein